MKLDVTRDVVSDLWPLYSAGEASNDSRKLVDEYLSGDEGFRAVLRASETAGRGVPAFRLSPDAERRLIDNAHERARMKMWIIGGAIGFAGLIALIALAGAMVLMFARV